jgi:hypothetical protein
MVREKGMLNQMIRRALPVALLMRKALENLPAKLHEKKNRYGIENPKSVEIDAHRIATMHCAARDSPMAVRRVELLTPKISAHVRLTETM